jgi:hypothetical protein
MTDHTTIALRAAGKALEEVVAPAVDSGHPLAAEQLRLVTGVLSFVEQRLGYHYARSLFELRHHLELAQTLSGHATACPPEISEALSAAVGQASPLVAEPCARTEDLQRVTADLAAAISALVRAAGAAGGTTSREVNRAVLAASRDVIDAQRAWFLPQGFEADPQLVPSIDSVLHPVPTTSTSTTESS